MTANLQKILEGLGLSSKEAKVYMACLELAGAPNSEIARKSGLNRVTNYEILKRLLRRGVVVGLDQKGVRCFVSIEPEILISQAKQRVAAAEHFLPELAALSNKGTRKPRIYFYEGIEGIKSIYSDSLEAQSEILTFTNPADIDKLLGEKFSKDYVKERVRRKIRVRGLAPDDAAGKEAAKEGGRVLRKARLFPADLYDIKNEIMIYDDTVAIFSGEGETGVLIRNQAIASSFKNIWQMAWENADRKDAEVA